MKTIPEHFAEYVDLVGGRNEAARRLGVTPGMVGHIIVGRRGVSPQVAMAVEKDSEGKVSKADLRPDLWG